MAAVVDAAVTSAQVIAFSKYDKAVFFIDRVFIEAIGTETIRQRHWNILQGWNLKTPTIASFGSASKGLAAIFTGFHF